MKINKKNFLTAQVRSKSEENTIEVVFSTGAKGLRSYAGQRFYEELEMSEQACDLSRLNAGAPFLNEHRQEINSTLGVVESATIQDGIGIASVRLSKNQAVAGIVEDIKSGILRNISVGYSISTMEEVGLENDLPILRATKWQPMEISLVAVPFDQFAQVMRSDDQITEEIEIQLASEQATEAVVTEETAVPVADVQEEQRNTETEVTEIVAEENEEQTRKANITSMCLAAGLNQEQTQQILTRAASVEEASQEIFKQLETKTAPIEHKEIRTMNKKQQLEEALLNRINARDFKVDSENPYKQISLMELATELIERKVGESDMSYAQRAITSSDVASLLQNVANKILANNAQEKYSYRKLAQEMPLRDFKATPIVRLANSGLSDKGSEAGDYSAATITNSGETITLKDRGQLFTISYKALMNDDLGVLKDIGSKAPEMGKKDIEKQLFALINANAAMADTVPWFHSTHSNIVAAGTAPTVAQLDEVNQMMRAFVDESSENMDLTVKYLIVPPQYELAAKQLVSQTFAGTTGEINPFAGQIEVVVSGRITGNVWYASCNPQEFAPIVFATMEGQSDTPEVVAEEDFNSKSLKVRVTQPSAVAAASYKGIIKVVVA